MKSSLFEDITTYIGIRLRIQEHLDKISWSLADKVLFFIYGLITLLQMRAMSIEEWGIFGLMIALHTWIFIAIDSFALQNIIQFGINEKNKRRVNSYALILQLTLSLTIAGLFFLFKNEFAMLFNEKRLVEVGNALPVLILLTIPRTFAIKIIYRIQEFKKLFLVNLSFFGVMTAITLYLLFTKQSLCFNDMLIIYFSGSGLSSLISIFIVRKELQFGLKGNIQLLNMLKFSLPWTVYSVLHYLPKAVDVYIVLYFFNTAATGIYFSAKSLFRVFDESVNAAFGLVYPAAVRQIERNNMQGLKDLASKAVSFLFIAFLTAVVLLEFGFSELIITSFLPPSYHEAVGQFNLLIIAGLGMPLLMLTSIIAAMGKPKVVLKFAAIGVVLSLSTLLLVGANGYASLMPLGIIVYVYVNAILIFIYMYKNHNLKFRDYFRAFSDTSAFLKKIIKR